MGIIFEKTPANLTDYDRAVDAFRTRVADEFEKGAAKHPSLQQAADAMRARPLPSEADADKAALARLMQSSITVERVFGQLMQQGGEAAETVMGIAQRMKEISAETIGKPEFRPLTSQVLQAVARLKAENGHKPKFPHP